MSTCLAVQILNGLMFPVLAISHHGVDLLIRDPEISSIQVSITAIPNQPDILDRLYCKKLLGRIGLNNYKQRGDHEYRQNG